MQMKCTITQILNYSDKLEIKANACNTKWSHINAVNALTLRWDQVLMSQKHHKSLVPAMTSSHTLILSCIIDQPTIQLGLLGLKLLYNMCFVGRKGIAPKFNELHRRSVQAAFPSPQLSWSSAYLKPFRGEIVKRKVTNVHMCVWSLAPALIVAPHKY